MNCEQLKQLLTKYNITTLEELEYSLDTAFNVSDEESIAAGLSISPPIIFEIFFFLGELFY